MDGKYFNKHIKQLEEQYESRPQFQYRLFRPKFTPVLRIPFGVTFRQYTGGWILKGFFFFSGYYIFFGNSLTPHLNREGYHSYDSGHHVSSPSQWAVVR